MSTKQIGTFYALVCIALWALIPVVSKIGQAELDHHQFLFWSSLVSFITMLLISLYSTKWKLILSYQTKDWLAAIVLGLLGTYVYYLLLYQGYSKGKGMEVLIMQYTWPIFIALLSPILLNESFGWRKRTALILGFAAVTLVITKGNLSQVNLNQPETLGWVAVGSFCFALFSVLSKKVSLEPIGLTTIYFGVATLASFISMQSYSEFAVPNSSSITPLLLNGIFVNGISYILWIWALRKAEASYLAPLTFLTPILSAVYLSVFFDDVFLPIYGLALGFIIFAGLINLKTDQKPDNI